MLTVLTPPVPNPVLECVIIFSVVQYLVRIVQHWTVVTLVTNSIHVSVLLVSVVHIGAVVVFIQNFWKKKRAVDDDSFS